MLFLCALCALCGFIKKALSRLRSRFFLFFFLCALCALCGSRKKRFPDYDRAIYCVGTRSCPAREVLIAIEQVILNEPPKVNRRRDRVEKSRDTALPCPYTLRYRIFIENEDGVFIPRTETGFLNLILGKPPKLSQKPGFLHRF
jgi:hypothetical protein